MLEESDNEIIDFKLPDQQNYEEIEQNSIDVSFYNKNIYPSQSYYEKDDHLERLNLLKRIANEEYDESSGQQNDSEELGDLEELKKKLRKQEQQIQLSKDKHKEKKKKTFVSPALLKMTFLTALIRFYRQIENSYSEDTQATILSFFTQDQIIRLEQKVLKTKALSEKLLILMTNFKQVFSLKISEIDKEREETNNTILYPSQFILKFLTFMVAFNIKVRPIMAVDFVITGLEHKFRVKAYDKIVEKNKQFTDKQDPSKSFAYTGTTIVTEKVMSQGSNSMLFTQPEINSETLEESLRGNSKQNFLLEEEQPESLDQFIFVKPSKNSKIKDPKISEQVNKQHEVKFEQKQIIHKSKPRMKEEQLKFDLFEFNNNFWLEIFHDDKWVPFDPVGDKQCICDIKIIQDKIHNSFSFFILTFQPIKFQDKFIDHLMQSSRYFNEFYLVDLTFKYLKAYKSQRLILQLEGWVNKLINNLKLSYNGPIKLIEKDFIKQVEYDRETIFEFQKQFKPNSEKEYKYHPIYVLESQLNQYQILKQGSQPCDFKIKDETVYFKKDIVVLHSKDKWRERLLAVKENEIPVREVTGRFDKTKILPLFGEWQCQPLKISLEENDGQLPQNNYGNFELFVHPPPQGTALFMKLGIKKQLTKANIPFVEAVDGFDSKSGKMFAQKCGYLIFEKDFERVSQIYEENQREMKERQSVNKSKELLKIWGQIFKAILVKKQIQDTYKE